MARELVLCTKCCGTGKIISMIQKGDMTKSKCPHCLGSGRRWRVTSVTHEAYIEEDG